MASRNPTNFALAAGAGLSGLLIGAAEGIYRSVDPTYSALLYAALCAAGGLGLQLIHSRLPEQLQSRRPLTIGFCLPTFALTLIMGQFIIYRDIFAEDPTQKITSLLLAATAAAGATGASYLLGRGISANFNIAPLYRAPSLVLVLACLAGFGLRATSTESLDEHSKAGEPPKLAGKGTILIVADALRSDALGSYNGTYHTPTLDVAAARSAFFQDATSHASWTRPAMASIMTSRHVPGHQVMSKVSTLPTDMPSLSRVLAQNGVQTAGVVTNYNLEDRYGFADGYQDYRYLSPARYLGAPEGANRLVAYNVYRLVREKLVKKGREAKYFYRTGQDVNRHAFNILDKIGNEKFFLWLHYMEPHDPFFAANGSSFARVSTPYPSNDLAAPFRAAYQDDVTRLDHAIAELMSGLKARGLADNITFVFTSDHGEEFGEHGGFYHGVTLYQEMLHVPFFIWGPQIPASKRSDIARHIDIAPTIAASLGVDAPTSWEGRDLMAETPTPSHVFAQEDHQGNILETIRATAGPQHKLILANPDNPRGLAERELFDLSADPKEKQALDAENDSARLSTLLKEAQKAQATDAGESGTAALDTDAEAELRALGYVE